MRNRYIIPVKEWSSIKSKKLVYECWHAKMKGAENNSLYRFLKQNSKLKMAINKNITDFCLYEKENLVIRDYIWNLFLYILIP